MPPSATDLIEIQVAAIRQETAEVKTFTLRPIGGKLPYKAGQFITFVYGDERRSYSFSSAPTVAEELAITVKRVTNGRFSRPLVDRMQVGDRLQATVATGQFTLPDVPSDDAQLIFFAAGIGITPIYSLIKEALATTQCRLLLVYSNSTKSATIFYEELVTLENQFNGRLQIIFLFSDNKNLLRSRLSRESLPGIMAPHLRQAHLPSTLCYVCGPHDYMRMVVWGLEEMHIPKANIRREQFVTQHFVSKLAPPDTAQHAVTIRLRDNNYTISVQYPTSILQAARNAGLQLPYSCNTGQCGSCAARCTSGRVWMTYNEVLTDKDLAQGLVLTCTGFPVTDDVHIIL